MAGSQDKGRIVVGISGEGSTLHVVRIRRQQETYQLLDMKRYTLQKPLDAQEVHGDGEDIDIMEELAEAREGGAGAKKGNGTDKPVLDPELEEPPEGQEPAKAAESIEIKMDADEEDLALMGLETSDEQTEDSGKFVEILQMAAQDKHTKLALSVGEPQIFYNTFETDWGLKNRKLMKRLTTELATLKEEYHALEPDAIGLVPMTEGHLTAVVRERNLAIIDEMEQVKSYVAGRLPMIQFVESVELSLVNMIRFKYDLPDEAVTLLLYVGQDYSRFIFLKGSEIHHISQMIADGANSPTVASTISSRLLFELDDIDLLGIDSVLLLGEAVRDDMIDQLSESLAPEVRIEPVEIEFLDRSLQQGDPSMDLAPFGAAIGAAMRALEAEDADGYKIDLTPARIKEGQNTLMISKPGWLLLVLIPLIGAFTFYQIGQYEHQVKELRLQTIPRKVQMEQYRELEKKIEEAQGTLASFERSFSVIDSLVVGTDTWSRYLSRVAKLTDRIGGFWFTDISSLENNQVRLVGYSLYRNRIPRLVEQLGNAKLERVDVQEIREKTVYRFEVLATVPEK